MSDNSTNSETLTTEVVEYDNGKVAGTQLRFILVPLLLLVIVILITIMVRILYWIDTQKFLHLNYIVGVFNGKETKTGQSKTSFNAAL